jgi:hypothetical protein
MARLNSGVGHHRRARCLPYGVRAIKRESIKEVLMESPRKLVEIITEDPEAMELLCKALARDPQFARDLIDTLNEAIADGARLGPG